VLLHLYHPSIIMRRHLYIVYVLAAALWHQSFAVRLDDDDNQPSPNQPPLPPPAGCGSPEGVPCPPLPCRPPAPEQPVSPCVVKEIKAAEDDWATQKAEDELAAKDAEAAVEAEKASEADRQAAARMAETAHASEKIAAETRAVAIEAAKKAGHKHKLSAIAEDKAFVAKDKLAAACRLAAHTDAVTWQADKEEREAKQTLINAQKMGAKASAMTKLSVLEQAKWSKIAQESAAAKAQAQDAMKESADAQGIVDRMNQQAKAAAMSEVELTALKAKEMEAKSVVASTAAKEAAAASAGDVAHSVEAPTTM